MSALPSSENTPPPAPQRRSSWPVILGLAAIVLLPLLVWEIPREKQRWKVATAVQERLDGKKDHSLEILDGVLEDDPKYIPVLLLRAQWQLDDGQAERALADIETALAEQPHDPRLLVMHSQVLQVMGKHQEAVADLDAILQRIGVDDTQRRAMYLNMAAYSRAIGNIELERALSQIDEALKQLPGEAALLDTRGFVLYRLEKYDEALHDIDLAAEEMHATLTAWEKKSKRSYSRGGGDAEAASKQLYRGAAVITYHRGLVYEALGEKDKAEKDFAQVREWGFEPDEDLY